MRISQTVSAIAISLFAGLIMSCSLNPAEEDIKPIIVNFPDPNFEALIRETLEIPEGDITNHDLWKIKVLDGVNRNISDITGIEFCSGLHTLRIQQNNISNLEPLKELVLIDYLGLHLNQIVDIKPLVDNPGIGIGNDIIYLSGNPLNDESILIYKPQLQSRGVRIYSDAILSNPGEINFVDNNFEEVIREHLNKPTGAILNTDLESITNINGRNRNIQNIYGIEFCINLDTLDVGFNGITDLIPLFYLRTINILKLDNNNIDDLAPLRFFYELTELFISNNKIEDLSYISNFTKLTILFLNNNYLLSIDALSNLSKLTILFLNNTFIQDISPLSNLLNLKYLAISGNPIDNFELLGNLDSLNAIELSDLEQFDLNNIKDIPNLETLYLTNTPILNFDPIANITNLQNLIMKNCGLSNIDSLANLDKLSKLLLNENFITDITSLAELHELYELNLGNNYITDILPLINNWGLGGGDYVLLYNNPLNEISLNTYIPQLQDRGVIVIY